MTTDLLIITFARDFPYLHHSLRSMVKFCTGFRRLVLMVPHSDAGAAHELVNRVAPDFPVLLIPYEEWPGMGFMHHMFQVMHSDYFTDADRIGHMDADAIFTAPVTPESFMVDGRPIIRYEPFSRIGKRHPNITQWQMAAEACLPFRVDHECMRCLPLFYCREVYSKARELIELKTSQSIDKYMKRQRNEYPQSFAEHPTLGIVAWKHFRDRHEFVEQNGDCATPDNFCQQFWSHAPLDQSQHIWVRGNQEHVVPIQFIERVLGPESRYVPTAEETERMAQ